MPDPNDAFFAALDGPRAQEAADAIADYTRTLLGLKPLRFTGRLGGRGFAAQLFSPVFYEVAERRFEHLDLLRRLDARQLRRDEWLDHYRHLRSVRSGRSRPSEEQWAEWFVPFGALAAAVLAAGRRNRKPDRCHLCGGECAFEDTEMADGTTHLAVCEDCCGRSDRGHEYEYDPGRRGKFSRHCDAPVPWDHYFD